MRPPGLQMGTPAARWVLLATVLGSGLAMLDATAVTVALARVGRELDAGFVALQWIVNGYTLTLAAFLLLGGSLGDRLGRRRVFVVGVAWFAVASLLCGLAPDAGFLVVARALQGIGGALLAPASLAIISASFAGPDRAAAVGAWSGLGGLAGAIGPFVGGWLVEWTWRAVFLVNVPVAAVVVVVALRHVPESRDPDAAPRAGLDVAGAVLGAAGLAGLTYALTEIGDRTRPAGAVVPVAVLAALLFVAFTARERRARDPLLPLALFRVRQFTAANAVTFAVYAALGSLFVLLVLQLQTVAGFGPIAAGTSMLPVTLIMLVFSARAGALAQRVGPRLPMTLGPAVSAGGVLLLLRIGPDARYLTDVLPAVVVFAAGLALTVAPLTATVLDAAGDRHAGVASAVNNAVARVAGLLAVALVPAVSGLSRASGPAGLERGFRIALGIEAGLLAVGALLSAALVRGRDAARAASQRAASQRAAFQPAATQAAATQAAAFQPAASQPAARLAVERCVHSAVCGPHLHPRETP